MKYQRKCQGLYKEIKGQNTSYEAIHGIKKHIGRDLMRKKRFFFFSKNTITHYQYIHVNKLLMGGRTVLLWTLILKTVLLLKKKK